MNSGSIFPSAVRTGAPVGNTRFFLTNWIGDMVGDIVEPIANAAAPLVPNTVNLGNPLSNFMPQQPAPAPQPQQLPPPPAGPGWWARMFQKLGFWLWVIIGGVVVVLVVVLYFIFRPKRPQYRFFRRRRRS